MNLVPQNFTRGLARQVLVAKKNSPHFFFAGGLAGVVTGTILACQATLKLEKTLDEIKRDIHDVKDLKALADTTDKSQAFSDVEYRKHLVHAQIRGVVKLGRLYGPAVVVSAAGIAALTGSHVQLSRRNAALSTTLAAVTKAYDEYRARVREEIGEDRELELYRCMEDNEIEVDGKKKKVKTIGDPNKFSVYARVFDETNPNWRKDSEYNRYFIQCQQNYFNHRLQARGHVFLNEVYDNLGMERSSAGAVVGWVIEKDGPGDNFIDFGMFEAHNHDFMNGQERSIWLDFNVDGVIYDKI